MQRFLILLICISLLLCGCAAKNASSDTATADQVRALSSKETSTDQPTEKPTEAPTEPPTVEELAQKRIKAIFDAKLGSDSASVDIDEMIQYPELPTGCEIVALTMALNSLGCDLGKTEIAEEYLVYGNYVDGYAGDPFSDGGAGMLPIGTVKTVENYTECTGAKVFAYDSTGASLDELYKFIEAGCPVLMWTTYYMDEPWFAEEYYYGDESYPWYDNEHCVTLCGYDIDDGTIDIADPIQGIVTVSAERFSDIYEEIGSYSVILLDTSDLK